MDCHQCKQRRRLTRNIWFICNSSLSVNCWTRVFPGMKDSLSWDYIFLWELSYALSLITQETENKGTESRQRGRIQGTKSSQPDGHLLLPVAASFCRSVFATGLPSAILGPLVAWCGGHTGSLPRPGKANIYWGTLHTAYKSLHMRKQKMTEVQSFPQVLLSGEVVLWGHLKPKPALLPLSHAVLFTGKLFFPQNLIQTV